MIPKEMKYNLRNPHLKIWVKMPWNCQNHEAYSHSEAPNEEGVRNKKWQNKRNVWNNRRMNKEDTNK